MKTILVAGGAGYIGSHMVALLVEKGYNVIVVDNLCTGHYKAVSPNAKLCVGDIRDRVFLDGVFSENSIDAVINFAAFSLVGESVKKPLKYYANNVYGSMSLLKVMSVHGVDKIVFSSSAAVYGEPEKQPVEETDRTEPVNPYGSTKLTIEELLRWNDEAHGIRYVALRYFNAAGADNANSVGEAHSPETHVIPLVLKTALGQRDFFSIFGDDYQTKDGTCIRDYVHVKDLAAAHLLALLYLDCGGKSEVFNLGSAVGYSVKEVVETAKLVTHIDFPVFVQSRRLGDPSILVASNKKARDILGWCPTQPLYSIMHDAWVWHSQHPMGYE